MECLTRALRLYLAHAITRISFGKAHHLYQNIKKKWSLELDTILDFELYSGWVEAR
jgi:hypothetical protein